jgi:hypothetical protein
MASTNDTTDVFDLQVKSSWFQGGVRHHIYLTANLARAVGARDNGSSLSLMLPAYVDGKLLSSGTLNSQTWFYTDVDQVFDALGVQITDAERITIKAQGRQDQNGRWQLHFWREGAAEDASLHRGATFSYAEVFPLVARLILRAARERPGQFVTHAEIVVLLRADPEGTAIVHRAHALSGFDDEANTASTMVAWFSQQITVGCSYWLELFEREKIDGVWAYRPVPAASSGTAPDSDLSAFEGEPRMFFHLRRERDASVVDAKRQAARNSDGQLECEVCRFTTQCRYPALPDDICEVHHKRPLGELPGPVETNLSDLAVLCPNCHRAIHRTRPMLTVEDFRNGCLGNVKPV